MKINIFLILIVITYYCLYFNFVVGKESVIGESTNDDSYQPNSNTIGTGGTMNGNEINTKTDSEASEEYPSTIPQDSRNGVYHFLSGPLTPHLENVENKRKYEQQELERLKVNQREYLQKKSKLNRKKKIENIDGFKDQQLSSNRGIKRTK
ncbi:hypothetical protein DLAC_02206 [Tieghemostelium lacteum]|uniref:Uncharacterized protein n=1 Tax=Tieghemostelium lacteum TaxID=361077 RepID=A0A152A4W1_TIELA|nr:hypothetical protein DLAC_02206 [Tieghemostelium lacteum]|eukprot:KYR01105.1 hypothetical protein DLAC_02206 [Tieghemostelium lacteum]